MGPMPDRPSHSTARDKGLIHPAPHCVRRGMACIVVAFEAAAAREASQCGRAPSAKPLVTVFPRIAQSRGQIGPRAKPHDRVVIQA